MTNDNSELLKKIDDIPLNMALDTARKKLKKPRNIYGDQIIFMLALTVLAVYTYGMRIISVCLCSVLCCIIVDMLGCFFSKKEYSIKDLSTICYGMALALMLPATAEYYIIALGALLAITVKHIFGGKDNYIFNPTAVAIAFLIICYPQQMLSYPEKNVSLPMFGEFEVAMQSSIESSFIKNGAMPDLSPLDILLGNFAGPMGTTHILVLIVSGICLLLRKSVSFSATVAGIASMGILSYIFSPVTPAMEAVVFQFIGGFVLFGFIFLASDPQTLPVTIGGRILYGIALGSITALFRYNANIEGVFVFALLITNALSLCFDRLSFGARQQIKKLFSMLKKYLGSYERVKGDVRQGKTPSLSDTQEIFPEPVNFNMPPIDNKITKVKRRKQPMRNLFEKKKPKVRENVDNAAKADTQSEVKSDE